MKANHHSYKNLPALAGLLDMAEAMKPGLSVNEVVERLKRFHYTLHRLWQIFAARLTHEPIYELKMLYSLHCHLCAEHVTAIRDRVTEMRHPPLGLDKVPHPALEMLFDEIRNAPTALEMCTGTYIHALPALRDSIRCHLEATNRLADAPTVRVLRFAQLEIEEMIAAGTSAVTALRQEQQAPDFENWQKLLADCLSAAGQLDGVAEPAPLPLEPRYAAKSFVYQKSPARDERFPDPYNMGVHAEEFLYNPTFPARAKTLMMYYKRLREIDVPEMMASILVELGDKPWEFYRDLTRQLWDEARHAMMGEVGFTAQGIDWAKHVMVNFTWSKGLNEQLSPRERHAVLWFIEQGLMAKTGKRYEWEVAIESGDQLATLFQDFDWADEVLHARIGRDWYVKDFADVEKAADYGSTSWSKVVSDWAAWKAQGLTQHRNWWPDLYLEYCRQRGESPDPATLAYNMDYSGTRADLQRISQSG